MEKKSNFGNDSSRADRQNVSFTFTKKVSKAAVGNKLEDAKNMERDYVMFMNENKIKSSLPKEKEKDLIIPLIKKNNWRVPVSEANDGQDSESKLKDLAVQELLKESKEKNDQWEKRDFKNDPVTIPLIMQNKIPEGYETNERMDVSLRPKESKLEDYDKIPVEKFGLAMLKGMGWKEGDPIGANSKKAAEPVQVQLRPKGLGLGADASALNKSKENKKNEEKLELIKGAYVHIIQGSNKGFYGQVLGLDEENARVIVKISGNDNTVTFPEFSVEVVSKKEFEKESKVINRAAYEKYKNEQENGTSEVKSREKSKRDRGNSKEKKSSGSELKRSYDSVRDSDNDRKEHHSKKRGSVDKSFESSKSYSHKSSKLWVRPQLRVRLIDDKYKKGRYFNEKVVVIDVLSSKNCTCKTENGKYLDDISPSMLETVIPRTDQAYVMIVQGKHSGELCTILERNKSKCLATVQFLSDRDQALQIDYDSICEYVGDVSAYD